jgi:hypothetical protein
MFDDLLVALRQSAFSTPVCRRQPKCLPPHPAQAQTVICSGFFLNFVLGIMLFSIDAKKDFSARRSRPFRSCWACCSAG